MTRNYIKQIFIARLIIFLAFNFVCLVRIIPAQSISADLTKLKKCGQYNLSDTSIMTAMSYGSHIYAGTEDGSIHAVDQMTLGKIWSSSIGGQIVSNLIVADGNILVVSNPILSNEAKPDISILRSLSSMTGLTNWNLPLPYSSGLFLGITGRYLIAVGKEGTVTAHEISTGNIIWKSSFKGTITAPPQFSEDRIILGTDQKELMVLNALNGEIITRSKINFSPSSVSIASVRTFAAGDERGNLFLIDVYSGKSVWTFKSGAKISFISSTDKGLMATSNDNFVYMLSEYNGDVIWKRRLPGRVASSPLVTSDAVSLQIAADKAIFLLDLQNGKILNQLLMDEENSTGIMPGLLKESSLFFSTINSIVVYSAGPCLAA